jgi:hypothetical protein
MSTYKVNQTQTSVDGTHLQGFVTTTYAHLVEVLGQPKGGSADDKTTCEWQLEFEDGTVATIYDWKSDSTPKNLYKWNIGGHSRRALKLLEEVLGTKPKPFIF